MIQAPAQRLDIARGIARTAQRQIKTKTGMKVNIMLCPGESIFETPGEVLEVIALSLNMSTDCYKMKIRTRDIVEMRFIAALLLRMHFPRFTLTQVAALFGGQDHTSIMNGIDRARQLLYIGDEKFTEKYNKAEAMVNSWLSKSLLYASAISA